MFLVISELGRNTNFTCLRRDYPTMTTIPTLTVVSLRFYFLKHKTEKIFARHLFSKADISATVQYGTRYRPGIVEGEFPLGAEALAEIGQGLVRTGGEGLTHVQEQVLFLLINQLCMNYRYMPTEYGTVKRGTKKVRQPGHGAWHFRRNLAFRTYLAFAKTCQN